MNQFAQKDALCYNFLQTITPILMVICFILGIIFFSKWSKTSKNPMILESNSNQSANNTKNTENNKLHSENSYNMEQSFFMN